MMVSAVIIFAACSKNGRIEQINGIIKLKVVSWDVSHNNCMNEILEAFKVENPEIAVEIIDIPSMDYNQKLQIMLNGKSDMDVFFIKDGDTSKGLNNRGHLTDISAYVSRDNIDLSVFNGLAERFIIDNRLVALPFVTAYYILYYNKDIFDKAGIPYPSNDMTWTEWEKLAGKITSGSGNSKIYGGILHTWQACVQNWALQDGKHTIMDTDYSFFKPYYEMALRMQNAGHIWDYGSLKSTNINATSAFLQGNVAMMPMGTWSYVNIIDRINKGESSIHWGIAVLPHPIGVEAGWTVGSVSPVAINQASRKKDAAWEFVKFVTGEEGARILAKYNLSPARADEESMRIIAEGPNMPKGALDALKVKNISLDRPMVDFVEEVNLMLGQEHSLIMLGEVSIEKGLEKMARRSKEIQNN